MKYGLLGLLLVVGTLVNAQKLASDSTGQPVTRLLISTQEPRPVAPRFRRTVLKINPLSLLAGQLSAFCEHALTDSLSIVVGYGMGSNTGNFGTQLPEGGGAYQRLTVEGRYYLTGRVLNGFYAGPYLRLSRFTESTFIVDAQGLAIRDNAGNRQIETRQALIWMPGLLGGRQFLVKRVAIDLFVGFQFQLVSGTLKRTNQFVEAMTTNFVPRFGLSLGYTL